MKSTSACQALRCSTRAHGRYGWRPSSAKQGADVPPRQSRGLPSDIANGAPRHLSLGPVGMQIRRGFAEPPVACSTTALVPFPCAAPSEARASGISHIAPSEAPPTARNSTWRRAATHAGAVEFPAGGDVVDPVMQFLIFVDV